MTHIHSHEDRNTMREQHLIDEERQVVADHVISVERRLQLIELQLRLLQQEYEHGKRNR